MMNKKFPENFFWGGATSASQIEGGYNLDGRGFSKLDYLSAGNKKEPRYITFLDEEGKVGKLPQFFDIPDNGTGVMLEDTYYPNHMAIDFYHNYKEDIKLLAEMGFKMFRMSVSWSRIYPKGIEDTPNQEGLDFYRKVFEELKKYNIEPLVTISHFDTPIYLENTFGGWSNRRLIDCFVKYAETLFKEYRGLVKYWLTFNEINNLLLVPELLPPSMVDNQMVNNAYSKLHHQFIASAKSVIMAHEIDKEYKVGCMISSTVSYPLTCDPKDVLLTQEKYKKKNYYCGDVMIKGEYPYFAKTLWDQTGYTMEMSEEDKEILKQGVVDFCSISYYSSNCVTTHDDAETSGGNFSLGSKNPYLSYSDWGWSCDPDGLRIYLNDLYGRYRVPMMVVENGLGAEDVFEDGLIHDDYRIDYMKKHVDAMAATIHDGVDLIAYTSWACIDSISASTGEIDKRYGFIYVDLNNDGKGSLKRYKKDSFYWYQKLIETNGEEY